MIPFVSKIRIYPIKSFDPVILEEAVIGNGCLLHDREFALFNEEGKFVNGKRTNRVNEIRSDFDLDKYEVTFKKNGETFSNTFNLIEDGPLIEDFLSDFFGFRVFFARCSDGRFLDVPQYSGVTIGSKASLKKLTEYFPDISKEQMRLRFRANIELSDTEPF